MTELAGRRVWVAGHNGMVGGALCRRLAGEGCEILLSDRRAVDLRRQAEVESWVESNKPELVFVAAAKVGGIHANDIKPAEFLYDNLMIEANIIEASRRTGVEKLLFLGSSCIYPRDAAQPMAESALLTGPLESTNQWYAIAKIAGIKLCQAYRRQFGCNYISAMPTNLYGPGDNFHPAFSHVLPALLSKMHAAKEGGDAEVAVWGSGRPLREFLYVEDCADALVFLMKHYDGEEHVNVGTGEDLSIAGLVEVITQIVGLKAQIRYDASMPDGTPRKLMDVSRLNALGWRAKTSLSDGIRRTYDWYRQQVADGGVRSA